jgi:hypothetical protein
VTKGKMNGNSEEKVISFPVINLLFKISLDAGLKG